MADATATLRPAGRRGLRSFSHEPRLMADKFVTLSAAPPEWDGTRGVTQWNMDFNDTLGDCGAAMVDHGLAAQTGLNGTIDTTLFGTLGLPKFTPGVKGAYFAYGISQGEPGPEPDQGVDNATWLAFLYKNGIIDGYVEIPLSQVLQYAAQFGGVCMGVSLSDNSEQEFSSGIAWGQPDDQPDQNEGHDILVIKSHADGSGAVITWGAVQPFTSTFINRFAGDAWVIVSKDDPSVDWVSLQAALDAVHGAVGGLPTPTPEPTPAPTPTPEPQPAPEPAPTPEPTPAPNQMPGLFARLWNWFVGLFLY